MVSLKDLREGFWNISIPLGMNPDPYFCGLVYRDYEGHLQMDVLVSESRCVQGYDHFHSYRPTCSLSIVEFYENGPTSMRITLSPMDAWWINEQSLTPLTPGEIIVELMRSSPTKKTFPLTDDGANRFMEALRAHT